MKRALMIVAGSLLMFAVFAVAAPEQAQAHGGTSFGVYVGSPGVYGYPAPYYSYYSSYPTYPSFVGTSVYYGSPYPIYTSNYRVGYRVRPRPVLVSPYGYYPSSVYPY